MFLRPARLTPLFLVWTLMAPAASGATFVVPTDDELIRGSRAIVIATVRDMNGEFALNGDIVTAIDLDVETVLKGDPALKQGLRLHEPGGFVGQQFMAVSGSAVFWDDNRTLLFLDRNRDGQWQTWGLSLGKFDFTKDRQGRELVTRWLSERDVLALSGDGRPHEEPFRDSAMFIAYIRARAAEPPPSRGPLPLATNEAPDYVVHDALAAEERFTLPSAPDDHVAPNAYTQGTFRWRAFDDGGSVGFFVSGTQPGYDSTGAAQRALAAWTNDAGSNVSYVLSGTNSRGFVQDSVNTIVYNNSTDVPAGAIAFAKWYGSGQHTYKGVTFFTTVEGDVVVKAGFTGSQKIFDEAVTHELGHTLGFRHSDQGTPSSSEAVMKAVLSGAYGASLGPWDIDAVRHVYTGSTAGAPVPPLNVTATATSTTRVVVSWSPVSGATSYEVFRSTNIAGPYISRGTTATTSLADTGLSPGTAYVYRVRSIASGVPSTDSAPDYAVTIIYTDDPLSAGVTIKAIHLIEIRNAVNALRAATNLPQQTWTDPSPAGVSVKAVHITEIRNALTPVLTAFGRAPVYTNPTLTPGTLIRAIHFQELRNQSK